MENENWKNLYGTGTLVLHDDKMDLSGMFNRYGSGDNVSSLSAVLSVYFSTMTAYAIHAYDFKLKKIHLSVYFDDHDDSDTGNCT